MSFWYSPGQGLQALDTILAHYWLAFLIAAVIISEIVYFVFVRTTKRPHGSSIWAWTVPVKIGSLCLSLILIFVITLLITLLPLLLIVATVAGLLALYFGSNVTLAKRFGSEETKKETAARKRREALEEAAEKRAETEEIKEHRAKFKYKRGDKVRIEDHYEYSQDFDSSVKIAAVDYDEYPESDGAYKVYDNGGDRHWIGEDDIAGKVRRRRRSR